MGHKNSASSVKPAWVSRIEQKKAAYKQATGGQPAAMNPLALQDYFHSSDGPQNKVLRSKSGPGKTLFVSRSGEFWSMGGLRQAWLDRGGRAEKRFTKDYDAMVGELTQAFPNNRALKDISKELLNIRQTNDGCYKHTPQLERITDQLAAAKRMQDGISTTTRSMRDRRDQLNESMDPSQYRKEMKSSPLHQQGRVFAKNATRQWERSPRNGEPTSPQWRLNKFVEQESKALGVTELELLEHMLLQGTASYGLSKQVFDALLGRYQQLRTDKVSALEPQVMEKGKVDLNYMDAWLQQSMPSSKPIDWINNRGVARPVAAQTFAARLESSLDGMLAEMRGSAVAPDFVQLESAVQAVKGLRTEGGYKDEDEFRQAMDHLLELRAGIRDSIEQAKQERLNQLMSGLEDQYLDHREQLRAMTAADIAQQYTQRDTIRHVKVAQQLNEQFGPKDPADKQFKVDEMALKAYFLKAPEPRLALQRLLTETSVPRFLKSSVFQAIATLSLEWELQAAAKQAA